LPGRRRATFDPNFLEDLAHWIRHNPRIALRLIDLVLATLREPFTGIGKPEPLKHLGPNRWSRRLTEADRVVYIVYDDRIDFLQARYHYG
jgi:toxin YoeB